MGIIRNAANRKIRGRIGDTTYYVSMDRQIARQALNSSNYGESARRSEAQQSRRVRWANLVNFYKASSRWMPKAFESKPSKRTDYNQFMSVNLGTPRIALTKDMASVGACIVDAYIISQGSLPSIQVYKDGSAWGTDILLGDLTITESTTIAEFTLAILGHNNTFNEGDQISFVSYQQYLDALERPRVICTAYEVTLDLKSQELLREYLPDFCSQSLASKALGTGTDISLGGFAYVHSRNINNGRLQVSTQLIVTNNATLIEQYSSDEALEAAVNSYGVDGDVFLDTGSLPIKKTPQPLYISKLTWGTGNDSVANGGTTRALGDVFEGHNGILVFSGNIPSGPYSVHVYTNTEDDFTGSDSDHLATVMSVVGKNMELRCGSGPDFGQFIKSIVVDVNGEVYTFTLESAWQPHE